MIVKKKKKTNPVTLNRKAQTATASLTHQTVHASHLHQSQAVEIQNHSKSLTIERRPACSRCHRTPNASPELSTRVCRRRLSACCPASPRLAQYTSPSSNVGNPLHLGSRETHRTWLPCPFFPLLVAVNTKMALRGTWQLQKLIVGFCDWGGSSRGIRAFMESHLPAFKASNPQLEVVTERIRGQHPHLKGLYRNKNERVICVKNLTPEEIHLHATRLRNALGRKVVKLKTRHVTKHPSVQGTWSTALKF